MLLDVILGNQNPFAQWADANPSLLGAIGSGIANGTDLGSALAGAARNIPNAKLADQQYQQTLQQQQQVEQQKNQTLQYLSSKYPDLAQAVAAGLPISQAWTEAFSRENKAPVDPLSTYQGRLDIGKQQGLTGNDLTTFALTSKLPGGNQTPRAGLGQPLAYKNRKTGEYIAVEPMTDGTAVDISTGQPVDNSLFAYDPLGMASAKTGVLADAKTAAAARATLPGAEQSYAVTQKTLQTLVNNPSVMAGQKENFGKFMGIIPQQMLPSIPSTNRANFKNIVDQLSGQAFLNIRQALKGAGQVTDYEGQKGEIALSRMKAAADSGDEQAFMQAVADYQDAINNGMALLRQQAQGDFSAGQPAVSGGGQPSAPGADPEVENILKGVGL